jgi:hypothetical protein
MEDKDPIEQAFQALINTKHLYQHSKVDFDPIVMERAAMHFAMQGLGSHAQSKEDLENNIRAGLESREWLLLTPALPIVPPSLAIRFQLLPVKTMCGRCQSVESFNAWDLYPALSINMSPFDQVFCIPVQCQACKSNVIVFLIHRSRAKIQLVGRSEIERVTMPSYIPKAQREYYSGALIAFNSGQVLPALFMLRTMIEQYMRTATKSDALRGDELCDKYAATLPSDFNARVPSLKAAYGKLSDALHRAEPDAALFEAQLRDICFHFESLALFAKIEAAKEKTEGEN